MSLLLLLHLSILFCFKIAIDSLQRKILNWKPGFSSKVSHPLSLPVDTFVQGLLPATILQAHVSFPIWFTQRPPPLKNFLGIKAFSHLERHLNFNRVLCELPCQPSPSVWKINQVDNVLFIFAFPKAQHKLWTKLIWVRISVILKIVVGPI